MTTAHRATFNPAIGAGEQGGNRLMVPTRQYSSKDLPSYTELHPREKGQGNVEDLENVDYRGELIEKELQYKSKKKKEQGDFTETHDIPTIKGMEASMI